MMKKVLCILGIAFASLFAIGSVKNFNGQVYHAEEIGEVVEPVEPVEEEDPIKVSLLTEHGKYELNYLENNEVELVVKPSIFYLTSYVGLNGITLVEDENTADLYKFTLNEGDNNLVIDFAVDKETLGEFSTIYEEITNGRWEDVFSLNTLLSLVKIVMEGGLLISVIRYFVKDKKLEKKVEDVVKENINIIIPKTTQDSVLKSVNDTFSPLFDKYEKEIIAVADSVGVLAKCMALAQENSPEARLAIVDALGTVANVDKNTITNAKIYIEDSIRKVEEKYNETMSKLEEINAANKKIVQDHEEAVLKEETEPVEEETNNSADGTMI